MSQNNHYRGNKSTAGLAPGQRAENRQAVAQILAGTFDPTWHVELSNGRVEDVKGVGIENKKLREYLKFMNPGFVSRPPTSRNHLSYLPVVIQERLTDLRLARPTKMSTMS